MNLKAPQTIEELFKNYNKIKVPKYQRAYSWNKKEWEAFWDDLERVNDKKYNYYYGHYIIENIIENESEKIANIIDGQQRITTLILFLLAYNKVYGKDCYKKIIDKFETVDYDIENFKKLKSDFSKGDRDFEELLSDSTNKKSKEDKKEEYLKKFENVTQSFKNILDGLIFFYEKLKKVKADDCQKNEANNNESQNVGIVNKILSAEISVHYISDHSVSIQVFELHNTRGLPLTLLDKFKAKLMRMVYDSNDMDKDKTNRINKIQENFAEIFRLEELSKDFRGKLISMEDILLYHLRVIDNGEKDYFFKPYYKSNILEYIADKNKLEYAENLSKKLKESVEFICKELKELSSNNELLLDCLILDKEKTLILYLLLFHKHSNKKETIFKYKSLFEFWERFLFLRNFQSKIVEYYDDFNSLFKKIKEVNNDNQCDEIISIIKDFFQKGFRNQEHNLKELSKNFICDNKDKIIKEAYNWWRHKITYLLYKYEISNGANKNQLRKLFVENDVSLDHILPQEWKWEWIKELSNKEINEKILNEEILKLNSDSKIISPKDFNDKIILPLIDGVGNLMITSKSENSNFNNIHPKDKEYKAVSGGSYSQHNSNKNKWEDWKNWENLINDRGEKIFEFLMEYFFNKENCKDEIIS